MWREENMENSFLGLEAEELVLVREKPDLALGDSNSGQHRLDR